MEGSTLFEWADRLKALRDRKEALEAELKQVNVDIDDADWHLSNLMAESETQNFTRAGTMFCLTTKTRANAAPGRKDELFDALRAEGYHTALDTSGAGALAAAREVLAHTDLVLADLKFSSEDGYRAHTGGSLAHTLDFLALTQELGVPLWVRHVVIPGLTDGEAHIRALARMAGQFHNLQKVELLGFRKLCLEKYGAMGVPFPLADTPEMDAAALCRLEDAVRRELPDLA